jgi:hypothetical protein
MEYEEERMIECPICHHDDVLYHESKTCDLCDRDICRSCFDFSMDLCKECAEALKISRELYKRGNGVKQ